ncbi:LysR substrate-binding domain-containing protein [Falsiroseomonas sp.]|uniref:LysR substrate-binding domain-containing protein n=1 Tax=Falsiroseomonas sp. TaxID=2870721 RepID=UPI003F70E82E
MNLRDLRYALAVAEHRHFGRAAELCHISQPTLSTQLRKLEEELGVVLFERTNKSVVPTAAGEALLTHARAAVDAADAMLALAHSSRDPLRGRLRLGVIPTLAPYLLPLVFGPLRDALPELVVEPWEDVTAALLERLRSHELDAALLATETEAPDLETQTLFTEPFLAALPPDHPLAGQDRVCEEELAPDVLVLADGHCLRDQALAACGQPGLRSNALRASSLATLMNMVAAGYGTTLIPGLAAGVARDAGITLRPLAHATGRQIRLVSRATFPRRAALDAISHLIRSRLAPFAEGAADGEV